MTVELLVSVRNRAEALAALSGGADIIDVKDPNRGPLGRADWEDIAEIVEVVRGFESDRIVSAAMGEIIDCDRTSSSQNILRQLDLLKAGPSGLTAMAFEDAWQSMQTQYSRSARSWVAVSYADFDRCAAPSPFDVLAVAVRTGSPVLLVDTFEKDESTLLDWVSAGELQQLREQTRSAGMRLALAGRVSEAVLDHVLVFDPDIVAVRGAVCDKGDRQATVVADRVRALAERIGKLRRCVAHARLSTISLLGGDKT